MSRSTKVLALAAALSSGLALLSTGPAAAAPLQGTPGAPGIGDPYFPLDGNGGYDVAHYGIDVTYQPSLDELAGSTTITARATQDLSSFDLDFLLTVKSVQVNSLPARFAGTPDGELAVTPAVPLAKGATFTVEVSYDDIPSRHALNGRTLWRRTSTGAVAASTPEMA